VLLDPVTLPCCGKSFDKACLDKHREARAQAGERARCPNCRKPLTASLPEVGARHGQGRRREQAASRRCFDCLRLVLTEYAPGTCRLTRELEVSERGYKCAVCGGGDGV
jgi:hypothetical protein